MKEVTKLPEFCYYLLPTDMADTSKKNISPVIIKRGEKGYYQTDYNWNKEFAQKAADDLNLRLGATPEIVQDMVLKSMFHWKRI